MAYRIKLTPIATIELKDSIDYYSNINRRVAQDFLSRISDMLDDIEQEPFHYREIGKCFKQVPVHKFAFVIIYEIIAETVAVHSFLHTSRNPNQKPPKT